MNAYVIVFMGVIFIGAAIVCLMVKNIALFALFMILAFCILCADYLKIGVGVIEFKRKVDKLEEKVKNLTNMVSDIYNGFISEKYTEVDLNTRLSVTKNEEGRYVYIFKLQSTPLINSIDLLWGVYYQPPDTYNSINNLLIFCSKQGPETLKKHSSNKFVVRYFKSERQGKNLDVNNLEILSSGYRVKSLNRDFRKEDFLQQQVIFE